MFPAEVKRLKQWVVWRTEERNGKATKPPYRVDGKGYASTTDPTTWATARAAFDEWERNGWAGLGFVFARSDPFCGIDLDHCRDPETGEIDAWAREIIVSFATYTEISPNLTGVHIWTRARLHSDFHKFYIKDAPNPLAAIEIYDHARYFTTTSFALPGSPETIQDGQEALDRLVAQLWPAEQKEPRQIPEGSGGEQSAGLVPQDIIHALANASNAPKFNRLMAGDTTGYTTASEADQALMSLIVPFYTTDLVLALDVIRSGKLWDKKWERHDYQQRTFKKAFEGDRGERYTPSDTGEIRHAPKPQEERKSRPSPTVLSADVLEGMQLEEPRMVIPDILLEGLVMLAAKPKIGKSWLALDWAISIASGGLALKSIQCEQGDVLFLALEDNNRRLQQRMRMLLKKKRFPPRLHFALEWPKIDQGGTDHLREWLKVNPNARLVIIDVWKRIRQNRREKANLYDEDYEHLRELKSVADEFRITILVVHHTRKAGAEDVQDEISGTGGVAAALDSTLILHRTRTEAGGELWVTGRDIEEQKFALRLELGQWKLMGKAAEVTKSKERRQILEAVMAAVRETGGGITPSDIADTLKRPSGTIRQLLLQMLKDGELERGPNSTYLPRITLDGGNRGNRDNRDNGIGYQDYQNPLSVMAGSDLGEKRPQRPCPACGSRAVIDRGTGVLYCHGCNRIRGEES